MSHNSASSDTLSEKEKLLMRIISVNQGLAVQGWERIAQEEGLTVATAK